MKLKFQTAKQRAAKGGTGEYSKSECSQPSGGRGFYSEHHESVSSANEGGSQ